MRFTDVEMTVETKEKTVLTAVVKKTLAPITISRLIRASPIRTRMYMLGKNIVYFPVPVKAGDNSRLTELKRGDVFFWPLNNSIGIALEDSRLHQRLIPMGIVTEEVLNLKDQKRGMEVIIKFEER